MRLIYIILTLFITVILAGAESDFTPEMSDLIGIGAGTGRDLGELQTKLAFAKAQIVAGKHVMALETLNEIYAKDLSGEYRVETLYYKGFAYNAAGEFDNSEKAYLEALNYSPGHVDISLGLAQTYLDLGNNTEAKKLFSAVTKKKPDESYASTGLGYVALVEGDTEEAEKRLKKAIKSDESNGLAHSYLGLLYMNAGDLESARASLESAVYYSPGNLTANYNLASVCLKQGYYDGAIEYYQAFLDEEPKDIEARYYMALCYEAVGNNEMALENIRKLIELNGETPPLLTVESRLKKKLGI